MTTSIYTYTAPLSVAPSVWVPLVSAALTALGPLSVVDASLVQPQASSDKPVWSFMLAYRTPGPTTLAAQVFTGPTPDADVAAANAYFLANPTQSMLRMFDLSHLNQGYIRQGVLMGLITNNWLGTPEPSHQQMFLVTPNAAIAGGASGVVTPLRGDLAASGLTLTATNPTARTAVISQACWCFVDQITGLYLIFPSCCY